MTSVIKIEGLSVKYSKTRTLEDVSFSVAEGDFLGIIGPNGGGKSTLLKALLGIVPIEKGKVEILGSTKITSLII